mgnify:CR=1 FL=1
MEDILVLLIVVQAVLMAIGYFALARQIKSTRTRLSWLGGLAAAIPILGLVIGILPGGISTEELIIFFEFYIYSIIANAVIGVILEAVEHLFLGGR